jgi:hypothetical protein
VRQRPRTAHCRKDELDRHADERRVGIVDRRQVRTSGAAPRRTALAV